MLIKFLNYLGLYTRRQYIHQMEEVSRAMEYAMYLEKVACDMVDPAKPIIMSDNTRIEGVRLQHPQQIITSPFIKNVSISNVVVSPKSSKDTV